MEVLGWLLDSAPAIRWTVLQDLTDAPTDGAPQPVEHAPGRARAGSWT